MGLLDKTGEKPTEIEKPYSFASGGINDYLDELKVAKQPQDIDESEGLDELLELQEKETPEPLEKLKANTAVANASGKILAIAIDAALPVAIGLFLKDDPENYKASEDEKEALTDAFAEYTKLKGGDIPPWLALMITILSIYGVKGAAGYQNKKLNAENTKLQKRIEELEAQAAEKLEEMDKLENAA